MSAHTTWTLSLMLAGALGAAAPAQAQEGGLGAVLDDILGQDERLDDTDRRREELTERAAGLCLDYAQERVEDEGGDDARIEQVVDADFDGDRVVIQADMSADYPDGDRDARVECEVDFDGDDEVVDFRQVGDAEAGAFGGILGDVFGDDRGGSEVGDAELADRAARLCLEYAHDQVRDNGGQQVRMERLIDAEVDGERVLIEAELSADYGSDRREARVECEVDLEGDNEVVAFRQR